MVRRPRLPNSPVLRGALQIAVVLLLIVAVLAFDRRINGLTEDNREEQATTAVVSAMLAEVCAASSPAEVRGAGLVEECRLARAGALSESLPEEVLPDGADPDQSEVVNTDVLPDDGSGTPVSSTVPDASAIDAAVERWFATRDLRLAEGYDASLRAAVADALRRNPPPAGDPGRPPTEREIARAVTAALVANPPPAGETGEPGRGIVTTTTDGCDIVFAYTDGTTTRVGPVCGPAGRPPTGEEIAQAVATYCADGSCRGPQGDPGVVQVIDDCSPEGRPVTDVGLTYDAASQTVRLTCERLGGGGLL